MCQPGLFFIYFRLFKHTPQFFTTNKCENCPSSIWCWDSNSWSLEHESPPITTRPGLPPFTSNLSHKPKLVSHFHYAEVHLIHLQVLQYTNMCVFFVEIHQCAFICDDPGLFSLYFCLFHTDDSVWEICCWLDLNCRPLAPEATADPQQIPNL